MIERFFRQEPFGKWSSNGIGDDCAIIDTPAGRIAVTTDMLSVGTHFLPSTTPADIGYKALAVNLSDLAASGASPRAFFLSIALPARNAAWLKDFTEGLMTLARKSGCALLGGDTTRTPFVKETRAPLTISITAMGDLPQGKGLTRSGAAVGDDIWVSGTVGAAHAALQHEKGLWTLETEAFLKAKQRLDRPIPRNALGSALVSLASAAIDISDGLLQDLMHILERSAVAADIVLEEIPIDVSLLNLPQEKQWQAALNGGDDYELIFTARKERRSEIERISFETQTPVHRIGVVKEKRQDEVLRVQNKAGEVLSFSPHGYDHFA